MTRGAFAKSLLDHAAAWDYATNIATKVFLEDMELTDEVKRLVVVMKSVAEGYRAKASEYLIAETQ